MVVIRLARSGKKKRPFHKIVVADSRNPRDGRFLEKIGFYDPTANEKVECLRLSQDRINYWVSQGAQLSLAVKRLVKKASVQSSVALA